jgi:hypothetical protein
MLVPVLIWLAIEQISLLSDYPDLSKGGAAMAYPYRSILSPIQFDDPSLLALGYAKQIAADPGATLHLLHVAHKIPAFGEPDVSENEHTPEEEKARDALTEIARQHLGGVKYKSHTASASPRALAKAVVRVATELAADLIGAANQLMILRSRKAVISVESKPNSASTWSVCCPRPGA